MQLGCHNSNRYCLLGHIFGQNMLYVFNLSALRIEGQANLRINEGVRLNLISARQS